MKNEGYTSYPNDTIVIIGRKVEDGYKSFTIVPLEVAYGKIDEATGKFLCVDNMQEYESATNDETINYDQLYYCLPRKVSDLRTIYGEKENDISLMVSYFRDVEKTKLNAKVVKNGIELHVVPLEEIDKRSDDVVKEVHNVTIGDVKTTDGETKPLVQASHVITHEVKDPLTEGVDLQDLIKYVSSRVIGNEKTIRKICTTIAANINTKNPMRNRRLLSVGPTGSGKSQTFKTIGEYFNGLLPVSIRDCTELSAAGYVGESVDGFLRDLYLEANGKIEVANRSILVLDEIDKLASSSALEMKEAVQDSLLKIIEGAPVNVELDKQRGSRVTLDTRTMTVVGAGAFSSIFEKRKNPQGTKGPIGFSTPGAKKEEPKFQQTEGGIIYPVTDEELKEFGFKKEFIPRFTVRNTYAEIDEAGYRRMLMESQISPLLMLIEDFAKSYNCEVTYDDELIDAIIAKAIELDQGGRSLTKLIQDSTLFAEGDLLQLTHEDKDRKEEIKRRTLHLSKDILSDESKYDIK